MKRKHFDKGISAAGTVLFVGLVQTTNAPLWAVAAIVLGLYECCLMACREARKGAHKNRQKRYITVSKIDAQRWAEQWFNPYKEVS